MKIITTIFLLLFIANNIKAQTPMQYNQAINGKWEGTIEGENSERILEIEFIKTKVKLSGKGTIAGFSKVEGTNKTSFTGTIQLVDGYFELVLKEIGKKTTNGVFEIRIHISDLELTPAERTCTGSWTSNKTKKVKKVTVTKQ